MTGRPEDPSTVNARPAGVALGEFVRRRLPDLRVVSMSQPEPIFARHNVVAVTSDVDAARKAVVELEGLHVDDATKLGMPTLGLVVLSKDGQGDIVDGRADPEGLTGMVASRVLVGGAIGAVVGALVIGLVTALLSEASTAVVAAVGGALVGGTFGAIWVVFAGMGGSDAYRQTFIAPELSDVCLVSLHSDDAGQVARARERLAEREWIKMVDVDASGETRESH